MRVKLLFFTVFILFFLVVQAQQDFSTSEITKVVLLGTGTPNAVPSASGPSIAIVVNDTPYLIDFGPGVVRRASAMSPSYGGPIKGLEVKNLKRAFLTHLHSDHTVGYPDLILTPWVLERDEPLEVYGPEGLNKMTTNILEAYDADIKYRLYGKEPANNQGWRVNSYEFKEEGVIYQDENVKVEAFPVPHGSWPNAWGFRFTTPDKVIVISGDTAYSEKIIEYAKGADVLVHEVFSQAGWNRKNDFWKTYHAANHTSTIELSEIANQAKPKSLVLYHILRWGASDEDLLREISEKYKGKTYVGKDLDIY